MISKTFRKSNESNPFFQEGHEEIEDKPLTTTYKYLWVKIKNNALKSGIIFKKEPYVYSYFPK